MRVRTLVSWAARALLVFTAALWVGNTSLFHTPSGSPGWIAHRGVHQTFDADGLTATTCTAARIHPPTHGFVENTLPSIAEAKASGADWVEIDLRVTRDGALVVFHDDALDCRTDGTGPVRETSLAELRTLDLGYGYTANGGQSFPLRGVGTPAISTLEEVLDAFPTVSFVLDLKGLSADEGRRVATLLRGRDNAILATGRDPAVHALVEAHPNARPLSRKRIKSCVLNYAALGWSGWVPDTCRGGALMIPANYAPWLWGWPHRLASRLESADSLLIVIGPRASGDTYTRGVDDAQVLNALGPFHGLIWTNRIEALGPSGTLAQPHR